MTDAAQKAAAPKEAKVGKYAERPIEDALMTEAQIKKVEDRPTEDQIKDYHQKHPTLKADKKIEKALDGQGD